jgi:hypothetical protein
VVVKAKFFESISPKNMDSLIAGSKAVYIKTLR